MPRVILAQTVGDGNKRTCTTERNEIAAYRPCLRIINNDTIEFPTKGIREKQSVLIAMSARPPSVVYTCPYRRDTLSRRRTDQHCQNGQRRFPAAPTRRPGKLPIEFRQDRFYTGYPVSFVFCWETSDTMIPIQ